MLLRNLLYWASALILGIGAAPVTEALAETLSIPVSDTYSRWESDHLLKRASQQPVSCGPADRRRAYPDQSVKNAYNALVKHGQANTKVKAGTRPYPEWYKGTDQSVRDVLNTIPGCHTDQAGYKYFAFPLVGGTFTGGEQGSQGPDRVIAISPSPGQGGTRQYTYCLSVTHRGLERSRFMPCKNAP